MELEAEQGKEEEIHREGVTREIWRERVMLMGGIKIYRSDGDKGGEKEKGGIMETTGKRRIKGYK